MQKEPLFYILRKFMEIFPSGQKEVGIFANFVSDFDGYCLIDRCNFTGHLTASAIVTDGEGERFLLLFHKGLQKWLQPGGHIDASDASPLAAAMREVEEETGLRPEDYDIMATEEGLCVIDFDSHRIPDNQIKGELEHFHHDIRFLFRLHDGVEGIKVSADESEGFRWFRREEFPDYFCPQGVFDRLPDFCRVLTLREAGKAFAVENE